MNIILYTKPHFKFLIFTDVEAHELLVALAVLLVLRLISLPHHWS